MSAMAAHCANNLGKVLAQAQKSTSIIFMDEIDRLRMQPQEDAQQGGPPTRV
jgi:hypothetical protein